MCCRYIYIIYNICIIIYNIYVHYLCCRLKYEKFSRSLFGRPQGGAGPGRGEEADLPSAAELYTDLTDNSPDLIPSDGKLLGKRCKTIFFFICKS